MRPGSAVVVGGGPGGVLLAYLLARGGVAVTLLESRGDFARRFRGDTLAPVVLDHLDTLGLAAPLLAEIPHTRADAFRWHCPDRTYVLAEFGGGTRHPYYALIPQARFLPWLADRARERGARVELGARFRALQRGPDGRVSGVEYTRDGTTHRIDADVVVAADGRTSKVRQVAGIAATELGASLDILWFAVPREPGDPPLSGLDLFARPGAVVALLGQGADAWQVGYTIPAGTFPQVRAAGVGPVRDAVAAALPWLRDRLDVLTAVTDLTLLPVRITAVDRWTTPGLLLIGDAAHVISPVGGNGINLALADAAEAANQLVGPLRERPVVPARIDAACRRVEQRRRPQVDREQAAQRRTEKASLARLRSGDPRPPAFLRLVARVPALRRRLGRATFTIPAPDPVLLEGRPQPVQGR